MRIGTFLLGGVAGAAAVVYLRNRKNWMFNSFMNTGSSVTDKKSKSSVGSNNDAGLDRVQSIVNEDAELKQKVNEIIADSGYDKHSTSSVTV